MKLHVNFLSGSAFAEISSALDMSHCFLFIDLKTNRKGNEDNGNEERDKENNKSGHKENNGNKKTTFDKSNCFFPPFWIRMNSRPVSP